MGLLDPVRAALVIPVEEVVNLTLRLHQDDVGALHTSRTVPCTCGAQVDATHRDSFVAHQAEQVRDALRDWAAGRQRLRG